jgi:hypothetical protein
MNINTLSIYSNCYGTTKRAEKKGRTLAAFDPSKSRANANYENRTERALAYSIYKRDTSITPVPLSNTINSLLGGEFSRNTAKDWIKKFKTTGFNINTFLTVLKANGKTTIEVSDRTRHALIIHEKNFGSDTDAAYDKINENFGEDLVSRELIEVSIYIRIF